MAKLKDSSIQRSGITATFWEDETKAVNFMVTKEAQFRFDIASKGGGRTDILLTVGKGDIPGILLMLAESMPELALAFAEATHVAIKNALEIE